VVVESCNEGNLDGFNDSELVLISGIDRISGIGRMHRVAQKFPNLSIDCLPTFGKLIEFHKGVAEFIV